MSGGGCPWGGGKEEPWAQVSGTATQVGGDLGLGRGAEATHHRAVALHLSPAASGVSPDVQQQLVPPRFLEKFTSKKVKKGSSITFSVKVKGKVSCPPLLSIPRGDQRHPLLKSLLNGG